MDTKRMRECAPLLPEPGGEVVCECLDEIERLIEENKRLRKIAAHVPADIYIKAKEISGYPTRIVPNYRISEPCKVGDENGIQKDK